MRNRLNIWHVDLITMKIQQFYTPYLENTTNGHERIRVYKNSLILEYPCPGYTDCSPYILTLDKGRYIFEVWGAQGGGNNTGIEKTEQGGKGGYSKGSFDLSEPKKFYIYIGSSGINGGNGGFNGGGAVGSTRWTNSQEAENRAPGGGATDIRLNKGTPIALKSVDFYTVYFGPEESLKSRIIVAGGGGGRSEKYGFGGGLTGYHGIIAQSTSGSQTAGGKTEIGIDGDLGYGGYTQKDDVGISGGGGGYYGGGATSNALGGSGFIDTTFFYRYETIPGNETVPTPFGGFGQGHSGDGVAKITYVNAFYGCTKEMRIQIRLFLTLYISLYVKF